MRLWLTAALALAYAAIWLGAWLATLGLWVWLIPLVVLLLELVVIGRDPLRNQVTRLPGWVPMSVLLACIAIPLVGPRIGNPRGLPDPNWGSLAPWLLIGGVWILGKLAPGAAPLPASPWRTEARDQKVEMQVGGQYWPDLADPWYVPVLPWSIAAVTMGLYAVAGLTSGFEVAFYRTWQNYDILTDPGLLVQLGIGGLALLAAAGLAFLTLWRGLNARVSRLFAAGPFRSVIEPAVLLVAAAGGWLLVMFILVDPNLRYDFPAALGVGTLSLFLLLSVLVGSSLLALAELVFPTPPQFFQFLHLHRLPVLTLGLVWFVVAALMPPEDTTHLARIEPPLEGPRVPMTVHRPPQSDGQAYDMSAALDRWKEEQCLGPNPAAASDQSKPMVPLILLATEGGGVRSAAWTTYVLDRVLGYRQRVTSRCSAGVAGIGDPNRMGPPNWIFAASGVSGGSVGLATYVARQAAYDLGTTQTAPPEQDTETAHPRGPNDPAAERSGWIRMALGHDSITPVIARATFIEVPRSVLRFPLSFDQAALLEQGWERFWWSAPSGFNLFDLYQRTRAPILILNGASVETGCRFNGSVLVGTGRPLTDTPMRCLAPLGENLETGVLGATNDLAQFLCNGQDIQLSTVALLGARFPYVSPAGGLKQCSAKDPSTASTTFVVDGGYHEGSGAASALELWLSLEPMIRDYNSDKDKKNPALIVPFLIQIDNSYREAAGPQQIIPSPELMVPLATLGHAAAANHERARQTAELEFNRPFAAGACSVKDRYARFALRPHPGPTASLGWTLSNVSFDELVSQLTSEADQQVRQQVRSWFSLASCSGSRSTTEASQSPELGS